MSENALMNHQQTQHDVANLRNVCGESFTEAYHHDWHTREKHEEGGVELIRDCGDTFNRKGNFDRRQVTCILSKQGATKTIKRRFEELCNELDDRSEACTLAFAEIRGKAKMRLETKCADCGTCFQASQSLKRHICKKHKTE